MPKPVALIVATVVVALALVAGACGESESDRPELTAWQPAWLGVRELVPIPTPARVDDDGVEVCSTFLGEVRERRAEIIPTPDESLDEPVAEWVSEAEAIGLDCDREGDLAERLDELTSLGDAIDARIELLPG